ncbi:MAG: helix-turn-helix domain-containing protein [Candidatus Sulfotelmatobacter sp.]
MMGLIFRSLEPVLADAKTVPAAELPRLLGDLREIEATALARLSAPAPAQPADELLSVKQAAQKLGCSTDFLYKRGPFPFARRLGRKLMFSQNGIEKYLREQK